MKELKKAFITPSNFSKLMAPKGLGKVAQDYADEVVLAMFGIYKPQFTSAPTSWGIEREQAAIDRYSVEQLKTAVKVDTSIVHPTVKYVKGKPDALIAEENGLLEVKCPYNPIGHLDVMRTLQPEIWEMPKGSYFEDYWYQVQGYLWILDAEYCDCISYDPRFDHEEQMLIQRVYPNQKDIKKLSERCAEFWDMVISRVPEKYREQAIELHNYKTAEI